MGNGLTSLGLTGLTQNVNKRESARQDLNTMSQMVQFKKQQEAEEQQAALMEQQYYEKIRAEADKMLSGDRKKINEKSIRIQADIKNKIRMFGGSRRKFMANGGLATIGGYTNDILNSEEVQIYKENKVNLERILDITQKGMGHLLTNQDRLALEEYKRTGHGRITYSGIMNEPEIPVKAYEFGRTITTTEILNYGKNFEKIKANYMMENPENDLSNKTMPEIQGILQSYAIEKGYTGRGENVQALQLRYRKQEAQEKAIKDAKNNVQATDLLVPMLMNKTKRNLSEIQNMKDEEFELIKRMGGDKWTKTSRDVVRGNPGGHYDLNSENYEMMQAYGLGNSYTRAIYEAYNNLKEGEYTFENGLMKGVDVRFLEDVYDGKGERLNPGDNEGLFDGEISGTNDYKFAGTVIGWWSAGDHGEGQVLMNKKGKEGNEPYLTDKGFEELNATQELFIVLEDTKGRTVYQKIDFDNPVIQSIINDKMGEAGNIQDELNSNERSQSIYDKAELDQKLKDETVPVLESNSYEDVFNSDTFHMQDKQYNIDPKGNLRHNLRKSFYLAFAQTNPEYAEQLEEFVGLDYFGTLIKENGLDEFTSDKRITDKVLLDKMLKAMQEDETEQGKRFANQRWIDLTKNYLTKLTYQK